MSGKLEKIYIKNKEVIMYLFVGGITTIVSCIVFYGSTWLFLDGNDAFQLQIANVLQWVISTIFAYGMNRKYVFGSHNQHIIEEFLMFISSRVVTLILDMIIMHVGTILLDWKYTIVKIISIVFVTIANYVVSKIVVFRK